MAARVAPPCGVDGSAAGWTLTSAVPRRQAWPGGRGCGAHSGQCRQPPGELAGIGASWREDLDRVEHPGGHADVLEGAQCLGGGGGGAQRAGRGLADLDAWSGSPLPGALAADAWPSAPP
jgi:hypothetical protein